MQPQKSHIGIVRSIRQVSLVRDWIRARGARTLPNITTFEPNERAGDALDLMLFAIAGDGETAVSPVCLKAGDRVSAIHGEPMTGRTLRDGLPPLMADAAAPIWEACIVARLPVYVIIPVRDPAGLPVTIEQVLLPYSRGDSAADFVVTSVHAWSTEGRFETAGLMRNQDHVPHPWAVVLDPEIRRVAAVAPSAGEDVAWADNA